MFVKFLSRARSLPFSLLGRVLRRFIACPQARINARAYRGSSPGAQLKARGEGTKKKKAEKNHAHCSDCLLCTAVTERGGGERGRED